MFDMGADIHVVVNADGRTGKWELREGYLEDQVEIGVSKGQSVMSYAISEWSRLFSQVQRWRQWKEQ